MVLPDRAAVRRNGVGFFDQSRLVYDGIGPYDRGAGVKKRAYYAYLQMIERLRDAELLDHSESDGVTIVRFAAEVGPVAVLWQDPWVREGPVWIEPDGVVCAEDLCGEPAGAYDGRSRIDLGIEPVCLVGDVASVSATAPLVRKGEP